MYFINRSCRCSIDHIIIIHILVAKNGRYNSRGTVWINYTVFLPVRGHPFTLKGEGEL